MADYVHVNNLILVFQYNSSHFTLIEKNVKNLLSVGFEPTTFCIRGKRLAARPLGFHGRNMCEKIKLVKNFQDTQLNNKDN